MTTHARMLIPTLALIAIAAGARADVLVLANGKRMNGLIDKEKSDSRFIQFVGARATQKIARDRVKEVIEEPPAQGYVHIGDEFAEMGRTQEALDAYNQALKVDAGFQTAKERIRQVEESLQAKEMTKRQGQIEEIETLKKQILAMARAGEFEKGEDLLAKSSELVPTDDQKAQLRGIAAELYLAWARDRMDRFDRPGAEEKLNLAYAADQENDAVVELLLGIWEDQADKQEQIVAIYENVLERRPEDQTRRRKLGDLYLRNKDLVNAARHYMELYKQSPKYKGTELEVVLLDTLDQLHRQFAAEKQYDEAISFYKLMQAIDPTVGPEGLTYYQYLQQANSLESGDVKGWVALADFAEKGGMRTEALDTYRLVLNKDAKNEAAKAALDRYALALVKEAQESFNAQDYYLAKALADRVQTDFPESAEAATNAQEVIQASNIELQRIAASKQELCKAYIERGDQYYSQALVFYRDFFDTTRSATTTRVSNPKSDAVRYFKYAIQMYEKAGSECPELRNDPTGLVAANLAEAKRYLSRLDAPLPPRRGTTRTIIGPDYAPIER